MWTRLVQKTRDTATWIRLGGSKHPARRVLSLGEVLRHENVLAQLDSSQLRRNVDDLLQTMLDLCPDSTVAKPVSLFKEKTGFFLHKNTSTIKGMHISSTVRFKYINPCSRCRIWLLFVGFS